jgi:hypothetical protein
MNKIQESVCNSVGNSIHDLLRSSLYNSLYNSVRHLVDDPSYYLIKGCIWDSVYILFYRSVDELVCDSVKGKYNE